MTGNRSQMEVRKSALEERASLDGDVDCGGSPRGRALLGARARISSAGFSLFALATYHAVLGMQFININMARRALLECRQAEVHADGTVSGSLAPAYSAAPRCLSFAQSEWSALISTHYLGGILATLLFMALAAALADAQRYTKQVVVLSAAAVALQNALLITMHSHALMYSARFLLGMSHALIVSASPMYSAAVVQEEGPAKERVLLRMGMIQGMAGAAGFILGLAQELAFGAPETWRMGAFVSLGISAAFALVLLCIKSPRAGGAGAQGSLSAGGGCELEVEIEMRSLQQEEERSPGGNLRRTQRCGDLAHSAATALLPHAIQQACGVNGILYNRDQVFPEVLSPGYICLLVAPLLGSALALRLQKLKAHTLFIISSIGTTAGLAVMVAGAHLGGGVGAALRQAAPTLFLLAFSVGFAPVPPAVLSMLASKRYSWAISSTACCLSLALSWATVRYFAPALALLGSWLYFLFACVCLSGIPYALKFLRSGRAPD